MKKYDAIIVGGGIAGLTAASFLAKEKMNILVLEKEKEVGGLVNSFWDRGFLFDGGARGIVDSGVVKPMLEQLGLDLELLRSKVSIGIESKMITVDDRESMKDYRKMLYDLYPDSHHEVDMIIATIEKVMQHMSVLYGIENPLFKDIKKDREYLFQTLIPWLFQYLKNSKHIKKYNIPVDEYMSSFVKDTSLLDIIIQHFFLKTPASFALSYFSLYMDYYYPKNGMGEFPKKLESFITKNGGEVKKECKVMKIDVEKQVITDQDQKEYAYQELIWAADMHTMYQIIDEHAVSNKKTVKELKIKKEQLKGKKGSDSILTVFLGTSLAPSYFKDMHTPHVFYTPDKKGQSDVLMQLDQIKIDGNKDAILKWVSKYLDYTTYEISIPALRDASLAPKNCTGLVVSVLMDFDFVKQIKEAGFYEEFKAHAQEEIIKVLTNRLYHELGNHILFGYCSTPLTIERLSGNLEGAITGFAFTNASMPSITKNSEILKTSNTNIPNVLQAGQWTFSPSGLPISILTGKIAANKAISNAKKRKLK